MKNILFLVMTFLIITVILTACGHNDTQEKQQFDQKMKTVDQKEKAYYKAWDDINLEALKSFKQTDATEDNHEMLKKKKEQINQTLRPKFKAYRDAAGQLPASNDDLKALKRTYLTAVDKKEKALNEVDQFLELCLNAIESNENILAHTRKFEQHRSNVEKGLAHAKSTALGYSESVKIEQTLIQNNENIKRVVERVLEEKNDIQRANKINKEVIPLIKNDIKALNKERINESTVNNARQSAIQMYYELEYYYKERAQSAQYSQHLSKTNVKRLLKTSKELEQYEGQYHKKNDEIERAL